MALPEMNTFAREDVFPSWWANSVQRYLSVGGLNFSLTKQDATHVHTIAGAADEAAAIAIDGKWRWSEVTVSRAHPGGAAGTYDIFAVAKANKIVSTPEPGTDETPYGYELRILKAGETPPIEAGVVDIFRKIGSCEWSGTEITRVDQTAPLAPTHAHRHATGQPDAIAPLDIGAAPLTGVAGNFTVVGVLASESPVDLTIAKGTTAAAGTQTGDKLALYSSGNTGFGFGLQTNRLVAYTPTTGAFAVRKASNAGNASSGTDAVLLWPTGAIQSFGGPTLVLEARTAAADANAFFSIDNKGKMAWGVGGGTATDTTLERSGVGKLKVAGELESGATTVNVTSANAFRVVDAEARQHFKVDSTEAIGRVTVGTTTSSTSKLYTSSGVLDALVANQATTEHYIVRFQQGGADVFSILNGTLTTNATVKAQNGITVERAEGSTAFQTWVSGVSSINPWVVDTVGKMRWGAPTGALDVTLERSTTETLKLTGNLTVTKNVTAEAELIHKGTKVGLFNTAPASQSTGWGTPTPPGGTYKTPLTYASTMNNIVDYVDTLATALKAYGILGA